MSTPNLDAQLSRLGKARRQLDRERGEAYALATSGQAITAEIAALNTDVQLYERAAHVLASIGEQRQDAAQRHVEALVTKGLQTIFSEELSFHLVPGVRAKTPVVDFVVRSTLSDGTVVDTDVMEARGGGLAATVGFLLRLVILLLSNHRQDTVLFLDETFAHVSAEYEPRLAEFLRELVDKTGVQIVMVTHSDAFLDAADLTYRLEQHDGVTRARAV